MAIVVHKRLLSVEEAAEYLSIGKTKLHSWIKRKKIPVIKLDSSTRFDVLELDAFVDGLKADRDKKMYGKWLDRPVSQYQI